MNYLVTVTVRVAEPLALEFTVTVPGFELRRMTNSQRLYRLDQVIVPVPVTVRAGVGYRELFAYAFSSFFEVL
jgi:hypothetical protein